MRAWLHQRLSTSSSLVTYLSTRFYQGESLTTTPSVKPFLVYTMGNSTDELLSDEPGGPERQFFQIYVHDEGGDYSRIDDIIWEVRQLLEGASSKDDGILTIIHLETSRDLDDSTMNTILRYIRFQAVRSRSMT